MRIFQIIWLFTSVIHVAGQTYNHRIDFANQEFSDQIADIEFCGDEVILSHPLFITDSGEWGFGKSIINHYGFVINSEQFVTDSGYFTPGFSNCTCSDELGVLTHIGLFDNGEWQIGLLDDECDEQNFELVSYSNGDNFHYSGASCLKLADGGIVVVGNRILEEDGDIVVVRYDNSGSLDWVRVIGEEGLQEWGYSIVQAGNGNFFIGGSTRSQGGGDSDLYLVEIDTDGEFVSDLVIDNMYDDHNLRLFSSSDGTFYGVGRQTENLAEFSFPIILKFDANGEQEWEKTLGQEARYNAAFSACVVTQDGSVVACGYTNGEESNLQIGILVKYDLEGNLLWQREFVEPENQSCFFNFVNEEADGGLVVGGIALGDGILTQDSWLVKTDPNGCIHPGCVLSILEEAYPDSNACNIWPNPTTSEFFIQCAGQELLLSEDFWLLDQVGRKHVLSVIRSSDRLRVFIPKISPGIYTILLGDDHGLIPVGRVLIE